MIRGALALLLGLLPGAAVAQVVVPTGVQHEALEQDVKTLDQQIRDLDARVKALEAGEPVPPKPPDGGYVDSGPITATAGQVIRKVKIANAQGGCIKIHDVSDVRVEDVILEGCGGHGVSLRNANRVRVVNSQITPKRTTTKLDTENAVMVVNATDVLIQGNVFRDFESGVEVAQATTSHTVRVVGNYSESPKGPFPRGQHSQMYPCNRGGPIERRCEVTDNYFWTEEADHHQGAGQEDAVNSGSGSKYIYYARNYIEGGGGSSGCGLIVEGSGTDYATMENNVLVSTAGCGINVANAAWATVRRNKLLGPFYTTHQGSGNLGIGNWYHSGDTGCHDNQTYENTVANQLPNGSYNDIWLKGGCGTQVNNVKGSTAMTALTPPETKIPPPGPRGVAPLPWTGTQSEELYQVRGRGAALAAEVERALKSGRKRSSAEHRQLRDALRAWEAVVGPPAYPPRAPRKR